MAFNVGTPPSVLVVGNGLSGGGAEARLSRLVPRLFNGQVDLALLSGDDTLNEPHAGTIFHLLWKSRFSYPRLVWSLRHIIRKGRYDAVIAFGLFPIATSSLAVAGMAKAPKFIISEITRPIAAEKTHNLLRRLIYSFLQRLVYKRGDLITANSMDGLIETCQLIGANPEFGVRLPNIVDIKQIKQMANQKVPLVIPYKHYLICVGRLAYMKRIDTVISALGLLGSRNKCGLVIVGDGEARQSLEEKVKALNLQDSVTFTGQLHNPMPLLKGASAFILASEYEGFSNSALEAMFCDVPVITSFCSSDAREMCGQGAALGFDAGDAVRLSKHISDLMDDESLGRKLIDSARQYRAKHEMHQAIPIYEAVICSVLERNDFGNARPILG